VDGLQIVDLDFGPVGVGMTPEGLIYIDGTVAHGLIDAKVLQMDGTKLGLSDFTLTVSEDGPGMTRPDCTGCHHTQTIAESSGMANLNCVDCHMPLLVKSAVGHAAVGTGPATGDIRSHIFRIDLEKEEQFTAEGDFAYPWITVAFACKTCHNGLEAADFPVDFLSTVTIHADE